MLYQELIDTTSSQTVEEPVKDKATIKAKKKKKSQSKRRKGKRQKKKNKKKEKEEINNVSSI